MRVTISGISSQLFHAVHAFASYYGQIFMQFQDVKMLIYFQMHSAFNAL
jgi:hypothetical protein